LQAFETMLEALREGSMLVPALLGALVLLLVLRYLTGGFESAQQSSKGASTAARGDSPKAAGDRRCLPPPPAAAAACRRRCCLLPVCRGGATYVWQLSGVVVADTVDSPATVDMPL
jgi:hypothetical protein